MCITIWRNLLPASSGQKLNSLIKNYVDTGEKGPLSSLFRVTWYLLFQAFLSNLGCCMFPHFLLYLLLLFFIIYCYLSFYFSYFIFLPCLWTSPFPKLMLYDCSKCYPLFILHIPFFLVLFYLHILSYMSLPLLCYFILYFILNCGIYHKTALFKGHWFLPYFTHSFSQYSLHNLIYIFSLFVMCFLTTFPLHVLLYFFLSLYWPFHYYPFMGCWFLLIYW
jgi:hypothetical protein